jgi:hypothetical protein
MSFGTTEGDVDGEIDYEPFIPKDPTAGEPTREPTAAAHHPDGRQARPSRSRRPCLRSRRPLPGRSTKRAAVLGGVAGAL